MLENKILDVRCEKKELNSEQDWKITNSEIVVKGNNSDAKYVRKIILSFLWNSVFFHQEMKQKEIRMK